MKAAIGFAVAATLATSASAHPRHGHVHHANRDVPSPSIPKRAAEVEVVEATVTAWEVAGEGLISPEEAREGIANGTFVVIGGDDASEENMETNTAPNGLVFKEEPVVETPAEPSSSSSTSSEKPTSTTKPEAAIKAVETPKEEPSQAPAKPQTASVSMTNFDGVDKEFPSGTLPCDTLPGGYGAVAADRFDMGGWLGIQWGTSSIVTGIKGDTCTSGAHCSYMCPEGYEKSQWPATQGSNHESIGGLFCNSDGMLELSRPEVKTLCQKGQGGVFVKSSLSKTVFVCRTDYPGTEGMYIPVEVGPDGVEHAITNPDQNSYKWKGMPTSAQYYINPAGLSIDDACIWDSAAIPDGAGDKAPTNFGTGMDGGITYFGLFPNAAVSSAVLDFNVRISVDGSETCKLENGAYSQSSSGCTGAGKSGQKILMEFY